MDMKWYFLFFFLFFLEIFIFLFSIQISLDFNLIFPGTVTNINEAWNCYYPFIIKISNLSQNVQIKTLLKLATGSKSGNFFTKIFLM